MVTETRYTASASGSSGAKVAYLNARRYAHISTSGQISDEEILRLLVERSVPASNGYALVGSEVVAAPAPVLVEPSHWHLPLWRARFEELASQWHAETGGYSSPALITNHPAYREITAMGPSVIPLILADLHTRGGYWYPALRALASVAGKPPPDIQQGLSSAAIRALWLGWGDDNRLRN